MEASLATEPGLATSQTTPCTRAPGPTSARRAAAAARAPAAVREVTTTLSPALYQFVGRVRPCGDVKISYGFYICVAYAG